MVQVERIWLGVQLQSPKRNNGGLGGGRAFEKTPHLFEGEPSYPADLVPAAQPRRRRPRGARPARPLTCSRELEALATFGRTGVVTKILH